MLHSTHYKTLTRPAIEEGCHAVALRRLAELDGAITHKGVVVEGYKERVEPLTATLVKEGVGLRYAHGCHIVKFYAIRGTHLQLGVEIGLARIEIDALLDLLPAIGGTQ